MNSSGESAARELTAWRHKENSMTTKPHINAGTFDGGNEWWASCNVLPNVLATGTSERAARLRMGRLLQLLRGKKP